MNYNKFNNIYIPKDHQKYDILPICRKYNVEMIIWNQSLLNKIKELTNMTDHEVCPYQRYSSYEELIDEIDNWLNRFPEYKQTIIEYKNSIIKMNNKDLWGIIKYIGKSNYAFTKNKYYYVVMYKEEDSWIVEGIIDNEEYNSFSTWIPEQIDLTKDFNIIIDPSNKLEEIFKSGII